MVKKITETEFKKVDKSGYTLIDFSATWCGPCKMLAPVLEEISADYEGKINFYNVDVDDNPNLSQEFSIQSIPALAFLKDGNLVSMSVGFQPKPSLKTFLDNNMKE